MNNPIICFECRKYSVVQFTGQFDPKKKINIHACKEVSPPRILCDKGMEGIPHWCPLGYRDEMEEEE